MSCFQYGRSSSSSTRTAVLPRDSEESTIEQAEGLSRSENDGKQVEVPDGMSRRLARMTDESIENDVRGARKAIEEGAFSEELRTQLEARIRDSAFKSENAAAFAQLEMPVCSRLFTTLDEIR